MIKYLLCFILTISYAITANALVNLTIAKEDVEKYYDSENYFSDIQTVISKAKTNLLYQVAHNPKHNKLAIILDIDDTSISNYADLKSVDFGGNFETRYQLLLKGTEPAIDATLSLYQLAIKNNVNVFFITGRPEKVKQLTENVLKKDGYTTWTGLYFKADEFKKMSTIAYKTAIRKKITEQGYTIIENIGDQESDLIGGYSLARYKLPNPFYYIP